MFAGWKIGKNLLLLGIEFLNFKLRHTDLGKNTTKSSFEEGNGGRRKTGVGETGRFLEGQCAGRDNTERRKETGPRNAFDEEGEPREH